MKVTNERSPLPESPFLRKQALRWREMYIASIVSLYLPELNAVLLYFIAKAGNSEGDFDEYPVVVTLVIDIAGGTSRMSGLGEFLFPSFTTGVSKAFGAITPGESLTNRGSCNAAPFSR